MAKARIILGLIRANMIKAWTILGLIWLRLGLF